MTRCAVPLHPFNPSILQPFNELMRTELDRAERRVEEQSVALKKPLGLGDLVLTQIVFVVGSSWVGTAAKLGTSHLFSGFLPFFSSSLRKQPLAFTQTHRFPLQAEIIKGE